MCGIVGYVGYRYAQEILIEGLRRLEYRGYDSAGISLQSGGRLEMIRAVGNLNSLSEAIAVSNGICIKSGQPSLVRQALDGGLTIDSQSFQSTGSRSGNQTSNEDQIATVGIGHTRWATHGEVTERNAHPHTDESDKIHIVVNGIVENYVELKEELVAQGVEFSSDTDVEVIAHLISRELESKPLVEAVSATYGKLTGHYAFVVMCADNPDVLVAVRKECPLIIGRGDGEQFIASAIPAFLGYTRHVQVVEDSELVVITPDDVQFLSLEGDTLLRPVEEVDWDVDAAEKCGYETFMLKEIYEQPDAVAETLTERTIRHDGVDLKDLGAIDDDLLRDIRRIVIVACGTSYHAGLVGRYAIEEWAKVPVEMDIASEYRYRNPVIGEGDLVIGITQSGETLDTLAAMRLARSRGAKVLAVTNVMGSQATRDSDGVLFTRAGIEIGVAATKTFVSQVAAMYLLALRLSELRGGLESEARAELIADLKRIPHLITKLLEGGTEKIDEVAQQFSSTPFCLYLGRHIGLPICLEGALKLKEISYIATDAYAAGEMKHGPIALLDKDTPVVVVATDSPVLSKVVSNVQEVKVRGAMVIAVATEGSSQIEEHADYVLEVPKTHWMLQPLLAVVPLQLLAYKIATLRGLNVDQPRNLAKTVTVE